MEKYLIVLLGPTGVGKTDIAVDIAEKTGTEIISADSRQFFREMSVGTAIPSPDQLKRVRHHFIHFLSAENYYSSSLFERDVLELLPKLFSKTNMVIMAGGSGMYIDAVCDGIDDIPDVDPSVREKYTAMYRENGIESLRVALHILDAEHYSKVDLKNHKRIIRALEICETTGIPYSSFLRKEKRKRDFRIIKIGLNRDRHELYERINSRVDEMIKSGLEEEARTLYPLKNLNALNSVGYKEMFDYFDGKTTFEKAVELIKRNSRRYAKRQLTWWGKDPSIVWFNPSDKEEIIRYIESETRFQVRGAGC
jgi:tRNA dimethylallyltransferase